MRTNTGAIWASVIALFLGFAAVTQVHSQDVFSRSLNLETPSSLTTLIANLSETNNELRNEIFDVRRDVADAQASVSSGTGTLTEAERQIAQLRVFSAQSAVSGPGISIRIDGGFDERALSDLVNELRNAGPEELLHRYGRPRDRRRQPTTARTVDGPRDRFAGCRVRGDDPNRRHHRSVRAHLPDHAFRSHQRDRFGPSGAGRRGQMSPSAD